MKKQLPLILVTLSFVSFITVSVSAQSPKRLVFDVSHGQNPRVAANWKKNLVDSTRQQLVISSQNLDEIVLGKNDILVLFSPTTQFTPSEVKSIATFLYGGGTLLLLFDEERRTPLGIGVNDLIAPFGMELTGNASVRHNCGAIAPKSVVCSAARELPYSGGRSIKGGNVISMVNDEGNYVHSAFTTLKGGGKIVVMSDAMVGLLMGEPDGVRFSGTGPNDSKYWGKDSEAFMKEVIHFVSN